jgi:hypothetical protein
MEDFLSNMSTRESTVEVIKPVLIASCDGSLYPVADALEGSNERVSCKEGNIVHRVIFALVLFACSCALPFLAACQNSAPAGNPVQRLQATYAPSLMDTTGYKLVPPGCSLAVQLDDIAACPKSINAKGRVNYCADPSERRDSDKYAAMVAPLGPLAAESAK